MASGTRLFEGVGRDEAPAIVHGLTADASGVTNFAVQLGPFGGAEDSGPFLWPWAVVYVGLLGLTARAGFARHDL